MGRKNNIEGQLSLFDLTFMTSGQPEEKVAADSEKSRLEQAAVDNEKAKQENMAAIDEPASGKKATEKLIAENKATREKTARREPAGKYVAGKFKECASCWCATCEHSTVGGSVPRPFGESVRPCPSCELCVSEGKADVCMIGSSDEGCRYRAEKEGLINE